MSRARFVVTPEARADLLDIWNYIAEDSIESADRVLARLYDAFTRLAEAPGMGHPLCPGDQRQPGPILSIYFKVLPRKLRTARPVVIGLGKMEPVTL